MEEINEIEKNMIYLSNLKLDDMFPKTILYPGQNVNIQFEDTNNHEDSNLNNLNQNYSNFIHEQHSKKLTGVPTKSVNIRKNIENFNSNSNLNSDYNSGGKSSLLTNFINYKSKNEINIYNGKHPSSNSLNNSLNSNNANTNKVYSINKHRTYTINFCQEEFKVYDVFIEGDLIAGCGGNWVKIYNKKNLKFSFTEEADITFYDKDEDFYAISYSEVVMEDKSIKKFIAAGGKKSIIRILDLKERMEHNQLIGHRNEVYDLKFHPHKDKAFLLLSSSQDFSIRLWHAINKIQICIFGGPGAHMAEVISIDWHLSGDYFVSSGTDYFIKIWEITNELKEKIEQSKEITNTKIKKEKKFKCKIKSIPIFSCNTVHDNYVDCVRFNGNFILSKSVEGVIYEWLPFFNKESDSFFLINTYIYKTNEAIWYIKFNLENISKNIIGVGNTEGVFFIFKIGEDENRDGMSQELDYFYKENPVDQWETEGQSIIRSVYFDKTSEFFALGNNEGKIYIGEIKKYN